MAITKRNLLNATQSNTYLKTDLAFRALGTGTNLSFTSNTGVKNQVNALATNITVRQVKSFIKS